MVFKLAAGLDSTMVIASYNHMTYRDSGADSRLEHLDFLSTVRMLKDIILSIADEESL